MRQVAPVSVVVPCYRCSRTIARAVASVAAQSLKPAEVILVEDGSGDETAAALAGLVSAYEPSWIKLRILDHNIGAASARNAGWDLATQPLVAFLDSDDAWHPKKVEIQYEFMRMSPDVALTGHAHRLVKDQDETVWSLKSGELEVIEKWPLLLSNRFVTPSVMVRNRPEYRFVADQRHMEDHMLWLQILFDGGKLVKLPHDLAAIYKASYGVSGLSAQLWSMEQAELRNYRRVRKFGYIAAHEYGLLAGYSLVKFVRRLLVQGWRSLWTN